MWSFFLIVVNTNIFSKPFACVNLFHYVATSTNLLDLNQFGENNAMMIDRSSAGNFVVRVRFHVLLVFAQLLIFLITKLMQILWQFTRFWDNHNLQSWNNHRNLKVESFEKHCRNIKWQMLSNIVSQQMLICKYMCSKFNLSI